MLPLLMFFTGLATWQWQLTGSILSTVSPLALYYPGQCHFSWLPPTLPVPILLAASCSWSVPVLLTAYSCWPVSVLLTGCPPGQWRLVPARGAGEGLDGEEVIWELALKQVCSNNIT